MEKPNTFVAKLDPSLAPQMVEDLKSQGFEITKPAYTLFLAKKKGVSCAFYESGKLTVQGKEKDAFIEFYLEPQVLQQFSYSYQGLDDDTTFRIGIDESGKGDFFGPLCIAGVFAGGESISELRDLGVRDSKLMKDPEIIKIGKLIKSHFDHHIVKINPKKYNELYLKFSNLNRLLAWGHATVIEKLAEQTKCQNVTIDQFAAEHVVETALERKGLKLKLTQRHKGEEDVVVAAASILARMAFVEGLEQLGKEFDCHFPKGASQGVIQFGKDFVKKYGKEDLEGVSKSHFKTLDAILSEGTQLKYPFKKPYGNLDE